MVNKLLINGYSHHHLASLINRYQLGTGYTAVKTLQIKMQIRPNKGSEKNNRYGRSAVIFYFIPIFYM